MKLLFYIFFLFFNCFIFTSGSQELFDACQFEENGYYTNFRQTVRGIVFTDNYSSAIYLFENGKIRLIANSPGCGRYFSLSPDKTKIGFKFIDQKGFQSPAFFDLISDSIIKVGIPVKQCGQPSFTFSGDIVYSSGTDIIFIKNKAEHKYNVGVFSNITAVSPDGHYIAFSDENQQVFLIDTLSGHKILITDHKQGYLYPQWSPDSRKISLLGADGILYVYVTGENKLYSLAAGNAASWSDNSEYLYFHRLGLGKNTISGCEIFRCRFDGKSLTNITNSNSKLDMYPCENGGKLIYADMLTRYVCEKELSFNINDSVNFKPLFQMPEKIGRKDTAVSKLFRNSTTDEKRIENVPYVNQKYDCPDWHNGSGSCAPATSVMALAFYNILPPWDIVCSNPVQHVSHYGSYISDKYYFNSIFYDIYEATYGTDAWGAYGFMWNGSGSPSSQMKYYLANHGLVSKQLWTTSCTFKNMTNEIDLGYPFPVCSWLTQAGHLTLADGYLNTSKTLIFHDPYGNKNTTYPNYNGQYVYYDWPGENNGYQNLDGDGTHGTLAWTVSARGRQPVYNDSIIDDLYFGHGFEIFNQSPAHMKFYRDQAGGYNGHSWWTYTIGQPPEVCHVSWKPVIKKDGYYKVSVFISSGISEASSAKYLVHSEKGDTTIILNQSLFSDSWAVLGVFRFKAGQSAFVSLGDFTGTDGQKLSFDAMKWEFSSLNPLKPAEMKFEIFPNPAKELIFVNFSMPEKRKVNLNLLDLAGNYLGLIFDEYITTGTSSFPIDLGNYKLRPAVYIIRYSDAKGFTEDRRLIIK